MGEESIAESYNRRDGTYAHPIAGFTSMGENGLSKREWMAGIIAAGLVCEGERFRNEEKIADTAVKIADAVLKRCKDEKKTN